MKTEYLTPETKVIALANMAPVCQSLLVDELVDFEVDDTEIVWL